MANKTLLAIQLQRDLIVRLHNRRTRQGLTCSVDDTATFFIRKWASLFRTKFEAGKYNRKSN